jgi:hypothetical protein
MLSAYTNFLTCSNSDYIDDNRLEEHFMQALTNESDPAARISAHFGINFISWHRWMTKEMGERSGVEFILFRKLWADAQPQLVARLDALFCLGEPSLMKTKERWANVEAGLKNFFIKVRKF